MGIAVRGGMAAEGLGGMAMAGMSVGGWSLGGAAVLVAVWTVMMAAMMLPAAAPMIVIFASAQARRARQAAVPTWVFVAGYLLVWSAAGVLVYALVQIGSDIATALSATERATWAPLALGATLLAAGVYQFTPLKRVCLIHCRSPFAFVAQHWRDGRAGALHASDGVPARCFLSRLLLGAVRGDGRRRGDEPGLDAPAHAGCLRRESAPAGSARLTHYRCRPDRSRADGRKRRRPDALDRLIQAFCRICSRQQSRRSATMLRSHGHGGADRPQPCTLPHRGQAWRAASRVGLVGWRWRAGQPAASADASPVISVRCSRLAARMCRVGCGGLATCRMHRA
jgi:Predicted metal-binding integral membrane protein (DUF2182)